MTDLDAEGPFMRAADLAEPEPPAADAVLRLAPGVTVRRGGALDVPGFKAFIPPAPFDLPEELKAGITRYWRDPVANADATFSPLAEPVPCHRFSVADDPAGTQVLGLDRDGAAELVELLASGTATMTLLDGRLGIGGMQLLMRLLRAGMVTAEQSVRASR